MVSVLDFSSIDRRVNGPRIGFCTMLCCSLDKKLYSTSGSLSNHESFKLLRDHSDSFNLSNVAELSRS